MNTVHISVVIPVYQCEGCLSALHIELSRVLPSVHPEYEIILVDDGSSDRSWEKIKELALGDPKVKALRFTRNFGQHKAVTAGIELSQGAWVVVMDGDLQHPPEAIPLLYKKVLEGHDVVYAQQRIVYDSLLKKVCSGLYHALVSRMIDMPRGNLSGNFSIISRKVAESFLEVKDVSRHYLIVLRWLGYGYSQVSIEGRKRHEGKSSYSLRKLISHAVDGLIAQSNVFLHFSIYSGFFCALVALISIGDVIHKKWTHSGIPTGWTSLIATNLLIGGLILISLGVLGIYIDKIFLQTKQRPLFVVDEKLNV